MMMDEGSHQADDPSLHSGLPEPVEETDFLLRASDYDGKTPSSSVMVEALRVLQQCGLSLFLRESQLRALLTREDLTSKEITYLSVAVQLLNSGQQQLVTMLSVE